jgi:beta-lactamase regulating signal transducer with metallopeptidase domain
MCRVVRPGPVARHALWVVVLLKLVTPPVVAWPWALPDPLGLSAAGRVLPASIEVPETMTAPVVDIPRGLVVMQDVVAAPAVAATPVAPPQIWLWIGLLWMAGCAWMLALEFLRYRRVARLLARARPADPATAARVNEMAGRLGIEVPPVRVIIGAHAPFIWPAGRATLVLPGEWPADTTAASIDALIVHELAHLKRRDHYVAWVQLAAGVVWWWNPLFWYVRATVREQAELACDAWVIATLPDGRRAYAESLITLSGPALQGRTSPSMAAVVGAGAVSRRMLERRLVMIMKGRTPLRLPVTGLVTLGLAAAISLPAWASGQQQPPPPPPAPKPPVVVQKAPPAPPAPSAKAAAPQQPPPPPKVVAVKPTTVGGLQRYEVRQKDGKAYTVQYRGSDKLPEDAKNLVAAAVAEEAAIRADLQKQLEAKHAETVKRLEALQDQYTKAGKLDEALAIRDYLRSPAAMKYGLPVIKR